MILSPYFCSLNISHILKIEMKKSLENIFMYRIKNIIFVLLEYFFSQRCKHFKKFKRRINFF